MNPTRGFSLIELSIVLVILGLLTGGILAGQSLIRAAEVRAVATEHSRFSTAVSTFRDKYFAIPGDFKDATRFWLRYSTTNCATNSSATQNSAGACDGNGDGVIDSVAAATTPSEIFQFWRQLGLAGLIEGSYSGLSGASTSGWQPVLGENVPASKLGNAGWSVNTINNGSPGLIYNMQYFNTYYYGAVTTNNLTSGSALKPEEAWNIDTKMDDGKPGRGRIIARQITTCTTDSDMNNLDSSYLLTSTTLGCALHFPKAF